MVANRNEAIFPFEEDSATTATHVSSSPQSPLEVEAERYGTGRPYRKIIRGTVTHDADTSSES